jgi:hypothetical protein
MPSLANVFKRRLHWAHLPARGTSIRGVAEESGGRPVEAEGREILLSEVMSKHRIAKKGVRQSENCRALTYTDGYRPFRFSRCHFLTPFFKARGRNCKKPAKNSQKVHLRSPNGYTGE